MRTRSPAAAAVIVRDDLGTAVLSCPATVESNAKTSIEVKMICFMVGMTYLLFVLSERLAVISDSFSRAAPKRARMSEQQDGKRGSYRLWKAFHFSFEDSGRF